MTGPNQTMEGICRELEELLQEKLETAGEVPQQPGAQAGYYDTALNVGLGSYVFTSSEQGRAELIEHGLRVEPDPEVVASYRQKYADDPERLKKVLAFLEHNALAEKQVLVADKIGEINKAFTRFKLLSQYAAKIDFAKDETEKKFRQDHYNELLGHSLKAIFGREGEEKLKSLLKEKLTPPAMDREILAFVIKQIEKNALHEQELAREQESKLEFMVRLHVLEMRERELLRIISNLKDSLNKLENKDELLMAKLEEANKEKETIVSLRSGINDKSTPRTSSKAAPPGLAAAA